MRWRTGLLVAGLAATAAAICGGSLLLRGPATVTQVEVVNRSEFDIHVDVSRGDGRDGWTSVTTVDRGSSSRVRDVLDQGDVWVFRFRAQGRDGGESRFARDDLRRSGWSLEVPTEAVDRLRRSGAPATP